MESVAQFYQLTMPKGFIHTWARTEGKMILDILINFLATTPIHVVISSTNLHHFLEHMHNRAEIMVIGDLVRDDAQ